MSNEDTQQSASEMERAGVTVAKCGNTDYDIFQHWY